MHQHLEMSGLHSALIYKLESNQIPFFGFSFTRQLVRFQSKISSKPCVPRPSSLVHSLYFYNDFMECFKTRTYQMGQPIKSLPYTVKGSIILVVGS